MSAICDYEGSDYRTRFWQNANRAYEDAVERLVLRRLLPRRGKRLIEFGAGFGRLADLYDGYDAVVLLDYSRSLLGEAMQRWGDDPRFTFVVADIYRLPFAPAAFDAATMVRVIHHIADVPAALAQIHRALAQGATFVLEFANKRHLKALLRYVLRRQTWNPCHQQPVEFVKLNFDFHPAWMSQRVREAGFQVRRQVAASHLRADFVKRWMPLAWMVRADALLQRVASFVPLAPSVFLQLEAQGDAQPWSDQANEAIFRSPISGQPLRREGDVLVCDSDGSRWRVEGRLYDFKAPLT